MFFFLLLRREILQGQESHSIYSPWRTIDEGVYDDTVDHTLPLASRHPGTIHRVPASLRNRVFGKQHRSDWLRDDQCRLHLFLQHHRGSGTLREDELLRGR